MSLPNAYRVHWGRRLVHKVTCPNCWHSLYPEEALYIARHPDLLGDPVLGPNEYRRFDPGRFDLSGAALDDRGFATTDLACPRCRLPIAEALLEIPHLLVSMIGAPASGKSYFLAAMTWQLRATLPRMMLSFSDADPSANLPIHQYEQTLFLNADADQPTQIRKTQSDDPRLYRTTVVADASLRYPVPLQFVIWPTRDHPAGSHAAQAGRVVILYDNAGEDFLPGNEERMATSVEHLVRSQAIFAFLDPTQDVRFRALCRLDDPQIALGLRPSSQPRAAMILQESLLKQATVRIRRSLGLGDEQAVSRPLIVIVSKADVWSRQVGVDLDHEAIVDNGQGATFNPAAVDAVSAQVRRVLAGVCPEFVATAENFSTTVRYIPVSSLGRSPEHITRDKEAFYGIRPRDIHPRGVTIPLLYCLHHLDSDLLPAQTADRRAADRKAEGREDGTGAGKGTGSLSTSAMRKVVVPVFAPEPVSCAETDP